jgi:signal recognition particle receptor subunit beta
MKPLNIVVTGEPDAIKTLIRSIGYGPEKTIAHAFTSKKHPEKQTVEINFGSLQVDEDYRIDFFGGTDPKLLDFVSELPGSGLRGMLVVVDADQDHAKDTLDQILQANTALLKKFALAIGITGDDYQRIKLVEGHAREYLISLGAVAPVFSIDVAHKEDVNLLTESLLCFTDPGIHEQQTDQVKQLNIT